MKCMRSHTSVFSIYLHTSDSSGWSEASAVSGFHSRCSVWGDRQMEILSAPIYDYLTTQSAGGEGVQCIFSSLAP